MRFLESEHDACGPLLQLDQLQRRLHLGAPVGEGVETIPVAHIIGTVSRSRDFDGSFHAVWPSLRKKIRDIRNADPPAMDEPIEVVRVDRAYFVRDGHKRIAIARETGREFVDARVSRLSTPYAVTPEVSEEAIERTAREGEFRRHSGMLEGAPDARFALTEVEAYGELLMIVQSYSYDRVHALGRALPPAEAAKLWYEEQYLPTVARGRKAAAGLLNLCTDAELFLALHRRERATWGSDCAEPECLEDMLAAEQQRAALAARSPLDRVLGRRAKPRNPPPVVLPRAAASEDG